MAVPARSATSLSPRVVARFARLALAAVVLVLGGLACDPGQAALEDTRSDVVAEAAASPASVRALWTRTAEGWVSPVLHVPAGATRAAAMLDVTDAARAEALHLEARGIRADGTTTPWSTLQLVWSEHPVRVMHVDLEDLAAPVHEVEFRATDHAVDALVGVNYSALVPVARAAPTVDVMVETSASAHQAALSSTFAQAGVQPRSEWNARSTSCSADPTKTRFAVHHTVTPPSASSGYETRIRGIQSYHIDTRGWCDIGYHFVVTTDGTVWEGREASRLGTHVGGHNPGNIGVSFIGCFHPGDATCEQAGWGPVDAPQVMIDAAGHFMAVLAHHYGITVTADNMLGHKDHAGASTTCPGDSVDAQMNHLRALAAGSTPMDGGPAPDAGVVVPDTGTLQGFVWDLGVTAGPGDPGNVRLTSASVKVVGEGLQTTVRASDAYWSFELPPGTYTVEASAAGYAPATRELQVVAGAGTWGSIGLVSTARAVPVRVYVFDNIQGATTPLQGADVWTAGFGPTRTGQDGLALFTVPEGNIHVAVERDGYVRAERNALVSGTTLVTIEVGLDPEGGAGIDAGQPGIDAGTAQPDAGGPPTVDAGPAPLSDAGTLGPSGKPSVEGGCHQAGPRMGLLALAFTLLAWRRRKRA